MAATSPLCESEFPAACARSTENAASGLRPVPRRMEKPVIHASRSVHENVNARVAIKAWKSIELATTCMI